MKRVRMPIRVVCLCLLLNFTAGCGVELAMLGMATSAASTGAAVYKRGKLDASWMASFELVAAAGEEAFEELGMQITKSKGDQEEGEWQIVAVDDEGRKIKLYVERRTPHLTEFQIDVSIFGKEATARLILKRMANVIDLGATRDGTN